MPHSTGDQFRDAELERLDRLAEQEAARSDATEAAVKAAEELNVDLDAVEGSGKDDRVLKRDVVAADDDRVE